MSGEHSASRSMFWRIERRLLFANPGRVFVILLALCAGSAVTAALLNLQFDAKRRINADFRSFGPNILVTPRSSSARSIEGPTLPESDFDRVPDIPATEGGKSGELYGISNVRDSASGLGIQAVVVGSRIQGSVDPSLPRLDESRSDLAASEAWCIVGSSVAKQLKAHASDRILFRKDRKEEACLIFFVWSTGDERDWQIATNLGLVQRLLDRTGKLSAIRIRVAGAPKEIEDYVARLRSIVVGAEVRPIRQFTEAQSRIYFRFSGLLNATIVVILILTSLCVMAAMTNIAMERKNDVALMKAIGGAARRVLRFFLVEATLLGFIGGLLGSAVGILLSIWLGKTVFGVAARPQLIVYPVSVTLTVMVAVLGALPLRRLASIRPAAIFRGSE